MTVLLLQELITNPFYTDACASLDRSYKPTISFVVVQKRHHARFFPMEQRDADRSGNCMPGTVSDPMIKLYMQYNSSHLL